MHKIVLLPITLVSFIILGVTYLNITPEIPMKCQCKWEYMTELSCSIKLKTKVPELDENGRIITDQDFLISNTNNDRHTVTAGPLNILKGCEKDNLTINSAYYRLLSIIDKNSLVK